MTERVLDNLISNAITYSPAGESVELVLDVEGDWLTVGVSDAGPGIPEQDMPHIFEAFYRGDARNTNGHAGLGLAIARRIMEMQGGWISVFNNSERGATFIIRLPVHREN
jgi:signal transduction histidine kinase